jgi:ABC-type ATPase involved in cell division
MIRFESVTKAYPDGTVAVDGLDLEAPTGRLTILVGRRRPGSIFAANASTASATPRCGCGKLAI